jgi:nicotinate phosphoribosyltransferase
VVFPRTPLIRIEGPLAITQLLETGLLNLVNYPSLVATNAARMRNAVGPDKALLEFGLRRAQGPDGGISASKYSYVGGFDATSNVLAGKLFDIGVRGTHAHSFVMSYASLSDLFTVYLTDARGEEVDFLAKCLSYRSLLHFESTNDGELAAFIAYAQSFPTGFLALIDTYDSLQSGARNFIIVGMALVECGYRPLGIRLDSGDLAYISRQVRRLFQQIDAEYHSSQSFRQLDFTMSKCTIVASNDIDEEVLLSLQQLRSTLVSSSTISQSAPTSPASLIPSSATVIDSPEVGGTAAAASTSSGSGALRVHEIDVFGIGTNLVTCRSDPALGCVYKLVEINDIPRIKVSQDIEKIVIPSRKHVYRLYGKEGFPLVDVMLSATEPAPVVHEKILVKHPFRENVEAYVVPTKIEPLLHLVYDGPALIREADRTGVEIHHLFERILTPLCDLSVARNRCLHQLAQMREDHTRPVNPTPYKVSVSSLLYDGIRALLKKEKKETILS